jgi:hypothetical protein
MYANMEVPMCMYRNNARARVNPFHPRQQSNIAGQAKVKAGVEGVVRRDTPAIYTRHVHRAGAAEDLTIAVVSCKLQIG